MVDIRICSAPGCRVVLNGRPEARYCCEACKKRAKRARRKPQQQELSGTLIVEVPDLPVPPKTLIVPPSEPAPGHLDAFERLREGKVLSRWKPTGDGKDVPDISDFLRR
jgi:hypothetical protein